MSFIWDWLICNYQWMFGTLISIAIAYHVYHLSKRITNKDRVKHNSQVKEEADSILATIMKDGLRRKVLLVNINRYFKDYPKNIERIGGYTYISAEIKITRFDGIEFFSSLPREVFKRKDGKYTFNSQKGDKQDFVVFPVGIVPYEWIDHINKDGDEFDGHPIFFTHFKGRVYWSWWRRLIPFGYPYERFIYYRKASHYCKENDHPDMEFIEFRETIKK
ncbi:MAG: hypothetical protein HEEMFOPI_01598 [Holosporales bacterium]